MADQRVYRPTTETIKRAYQTTETTETKEHQHQSFESLLSTIGVGRWTFFMFLSYFLWASVLPYFSLAGAFYTPAVDHWCKVPQLANSSWTIQQQINYSIPWENRGGQVERSQCRVLVRDYESVANKPWSQDLVTSPQEADALPTRDCQDFYYDTSVFSNTVNMEWDLVCGRAGLNPFFQSFYFIGTTVGEPLMGFLADRYGRRWVISVSALMFALTSIGSALAPLYSLVLAGRFVLGMIHAIIGPAYIQGMEACPTRVRTIVGLLATAPFAVTGMLYGTWAYLLREWWVLQLVCTMPVALLLLQIPFMDESPRWLMMKGRCEEAASALLKAARWQGVNLPPRPQLMALLEKFRLESCDGGKDAVSGEEWEVPRETTGTCLGKVLVGWRGATVLVRTPAIRTITLSLFGCWFCTGLTYWGMSLSGTNFSNDPFLYMVLSSLVEIPGYTGFTPFVSRFGRRSVLAFNFAVCAVAILTILATPASYTWMVFSLALVGKLFITGSYGLMYLVSSELFPTCVRSRGLNISSMMARLGSIVSPFIIKLLAATHWWAPSVMFGLCAAVGSVFALLLPDSSNKPMTDTVDQLELLYGLRAPSSSSIEKGVTVPLANNQTPDDAINQSQDTRPNEAGV